MEEILNILYEFIFANPYDVNMGIAPLVAGALVSGVGKLVGGLFGSSRARRARRAAAAEKRRLKGELKSLEKNRQSIINPYDNTKDLSSLAKDLTGKLSNPYANLSVSTAGAAMQAEEADIALANTLDTLRATGGSAGGATALAQAALQSKKGVSASIEKQEATNEKMRASGEERLQAAEVREGERLQRIDIMEGQRVQSATSRGRSFAFNAQEQREGSKINYTRGLISGAQRRETNAYNAETRAMGAVIGAGTGLASMGAVGFARGGFGGKGALNKSLGG